MSAAGAIGQVDSERARALRLVPVPAQTVPPAAHVSAHNPSRTAAACARKVAAAAADMEPLS